MKLHGPQPEWGRFSPLFDGQPLAEAPHVADAQFAGNILALHADCRGSLGRRLLFIRGPEPAVVREFGLPDRARFRLSDDGARVALQTAPREVSVFETCVSGPPLSQMSPGLCHNNLEVRLGPDRLDVCIGQFRHQFQWRADELNYVRSSTGVPHTDSDATLLDMPVLPGAASYAPLTRYDPARFHPWGSNGRLRVEADRFGHVVVMDAAGERLIAMLWFQRNKAAAWLPDGTRWGDPELAGPAVAVTAAASLARALGQAGK
jgi:hypothetical protein